MSLTIEESEEFNRIRNELIALTTAFQQLARDVGAAPLAEGDPTVPIGPLPPLNTIPEDIRAGIGMPEDAASLAWKKTQANLADTSPEK